MVYGRNFTYCGTAVGDNLDQLLPGVRSIEPAVRNFRMKWSYVHLFQLLLGNY